MQDTEKTIQILLNGGVGVLPTDTIYGLVARALDQKAVDRVYKIKKRTPTKPFIILIADVKDLQLFEITPSVLSCNYYGKDKKDSLNDLVWPGPVSVVLPCNSPRFAYLRADSNTLAFRVPDDENLRLILRKTGPLIAPSANPEGFSPAKTIEEAKEYFADTVDFYNDGGVLDIQPSTLITIKNNKVVILRQGKGIIPDSLL
ncbi:MAG: L-threonylcarbamoyladenylate synthase [Candidatus Paceibacterota bacterium]|jgi:L-threonylcarbamoyladenylate synthase